MSAVVCTPQPPRPPSLPSASRIFTSRLFSPHALDSSPDHRVRLGPSEVHRHLLLLLRLAHYLWVRETAVARPVLAWRGLSAGRCCAKARMHPAGDGDGSASMRPDSQSAACACVCRGRPTRSCWSGARFTNQCPLQLGWDCTGWLLVSARVCPWLRSPAVGGRGGGEPFAADSGPGW